MRLTIGIPCYDSIKIDTAICLALAIRLLPDEPRIHVEKGPYVAWNREKLAVRAIEKEQTHLMMIDTDLIFPPAGIQRLMQHGTDVAYGTYNRKNRDYDERLKDPTGFMLIKLDSLKKLERPYFKAEDGVGEDVFFCRKARKSGLSVFCDPTIEIGHIGEKVY